MDPTERYREATPESAALAAEARGYMPGGDSRSVTYHRPYPSFVERAAGPHLYTADGEELLDFLNNYTQAVLGHAPDGVVDAACERFRRGNGLAAPTTDATDLAARIVTRTPAVESVRFCNSGTEATMNAIRAAMARTGRERVLKVEGGYHGTHDTVEVAVGDEGASGIPSDVHDRVDAVPFNDAAALTDAFAERGDEYACFILEPVIGVGGMIPAEAAYLETARDLTADAGAALIFDEVMTYRLAPGGAAERYGVEPDLMALGKLIGGGLPIGAFGGGDAYMRQFHPEEGSLKHSGTFNANPTTMAAGAATLDRFGRDEIDRLNRLGDGLRDRLAAVAADADVPATVTGAGSLFQIHTTAGPVTDHASAAAGTDACEELFLRLRNDGVFLAPRGTGNLSTPMTDDHLDAFVAAVEDALAAMDPAVAAAD